MTRVHSIEPTPTLFGSVAQGRGGGTAYATPSPLPEITPSPLPEITPSPLPEITPSPLNKITPTKVRSPLRYPGGKSRAVDTILGLMPPSLNRIASPFFGGGSIELALISQGVRVYGYDAFSPLVAFWQAVMDAPESLADKVAQHHPISRTQFYQLQKMMQAGTVAPDDMAAVFYVLNRCSFSGTTMSGGMSPGHPRFTQSSIERVRVFDSYDLLSVENLGFEESLANHANDFLYCDPPYANGGALYGQKGDCHLGFNHQSLAQILTARDGWILSYNDCAIVRDLYQGYTILEAEWTYGMNSDKKSNEVIILSQDFKNFDG